jgi:hypothetical protein
MLEEINKHDYLGTPEYFCDLINLLKSSDSSWSAKELRHYFINRIYKYPYIDGGIELLLAAGLLVMKDKRIVLTFNDDSTHISPTVASSMVAGRLLASLKEKGELTSLFDPLAIAVDYSKDALIVGPQSFPLRHRAIRALLVDLLIIQKQDDAPGFVINPPYDVLLRQTLVRSTARRKMSVDQLKANLLRQERLGSDAEDFVLEYERKRLAGHADAGKIMRISQIDVSAGYDVVSFNSLTSKLNDRFIEVKSYSGTPSFYWTQNEIDVAKAKATNYFLYLVDRSVMGEVGYAPQIIQNPFASVYSSDEWAKLPTVVFVTKID